MRRADDHDVLGDDGRGMESYFAGDWIDLLIVILLQIDDTVVAEGVGSPGTELEFAL